MKPFKGIADDNIEKSVRRGQSVPNGAVNLAWSKAPSISPKNNLVIIDTTRIADSNQIRSTKRSQVAYANAVGQLEDEFGNQIWEEEYPIISDQFISDKDWDNTDILPFVHVSRFFHIDRASYAMPNSLIEYRFENIKVIDNNGKDYVDLDGKKKYKIFLTPGPALIDPSERIDVYRVYVFLDMDPLNDSLFLSYDKIELSEKGVRKNREFSYQESINARSYFKYLPEESDVIDHSNYFQKVYSTKPITTKEQVIGMAQPHIEGWKIFVPRKAIYDPRIFQVFRWRVGCEFIQDVEVDPARSFESIKCGVVVTNATVNQVVDPDEPSSQNASSRAPYIFHHLNITDYNFNSIKFINPLQSSHANSDQVTAQYWYVNIDTVSENELRQFDILVWSPTTVKIDLADPISNYLAKLTYFTETLGGTVVFDTANAGHIKGLGIETSVPVNTYGVGKTISYSDPNFSGYPSFSNVTHAIGNTIAAADTEDLVFDGNAQYGAWDFNDGTSDEYNTISPYKQDLGGFTKLQYIEAYPSDYRVILEAQTSENGNPVKPVLIGKSFTSGGNIFFSTLGLTTTVNSVFDFRSSSILSNNIGRIAYSESSIYKGSLYKEHLSALIVEGATKLMYNIAMISTRLKNIDEADEFTFSSVYTVYSDWIPSWVINPADDVLSESEKIKYDFVLLPVDPTSTEVRWQRTLSSKTVKQLIEEKLTEDQKLRLTSAQRKYRLYTTNQRVLVQDTTLLYDDSIPRVWTQEYSPKFKVPDGFGPHVIRDEEIKAAYDPGSYVYKTYPPKPFTLQASNQFIRTTEQTETVSTTVRMTGTADLTSQLILTTPGEASRIVDVDLSWTKHGGNQFKISPWPFHQGVQHPIGMETWQELVYYSKSFARANLNWPYWGANVQLSRIIGSSGDWVRFLQDALNRFYWFNNITGFVPSSRRGLAVDGYYGIETEQQVRDFQAHARATWVDGIVDAQTWSLIGWMIIKLRDNAVNGDIGAINNGDYTRAFAWPERYMKLEKISDGDTNSVFAKRSWVSSHGPDIIFDAFKIAFSKSYQILGITFIPFMFDSRTRSERLTWLNVSNGDFDMVNTNPIYGMWPGASVNGTLWADTATRFDIWPTWGNTVGFCLHQDQPAGYGMARVIGLRDVKVHAKEEIVGTPPTTYVSNITKTVPIYFETTVQIEAGKAFIITPTPTVDNIAQYLPAGRTGTLSNYNWTGVSITNPSKVYWELKQGSSTYGEGFQNFVLNPDLGPVSLILKHFASNNVQYPATNTVGPIIGQRGTTAYRTMTVNGIVDQFSRTDGFISKQDGIRLICDAEGNPFGFPSNLPEASTIGETQFHYVDFRLNSFGSDPWVFYGFYDKNKKEFVSTNENSSQMSFIDYITRGPQNIYIGLVSRYELDISANLPDVLDAPLVPRKWAMPVYGVTYSGARSKIGIGTLSPYLTIDNIWPLPITVSNFSKPILLRKRSDGALTNYLGNYQGSQITAHYSVIEAEKGSWSDIFGRPYVDVKDENPMILDDNVIQVRRAPILYVQEPSATGYTLADPYWPIISIWKRRDILSDWEEIPLHKIKDYNVNTGIIIFDEDLYSNDPNLIKVSYTTKQNVYHMKFDGTNRINLNPYVNRDSSWLNRPIYVYILPKFVYDENGQIIQDSIRTKTIQITFDTSIFDPLQTEYNPTAILLGIVYITSAFNIQDLMLLDSRKRGGGVDSGLEDNELGRINKETSSYWDVNSDEVKAYQKGGFVIVRLPVELKNDFVERDIIEIIEKNITLGVRFKIEDLQGNPW